MLKLINKIMSNKTSSPKGGKRGCLCENGTYSVDCCKGELINQGIGTLVEQSEEVIVKVSNERTIVTSNG
jgi:hypothetical protein